MGAGGQIINLWIPVHVAGNLVHFSAVNQEPGEIKVSV